MIWSSNLFKYAFFLWLCLWIILGISCSQHKPKTPKKVAYTLSENEINLLQEGDVILRKGHGLVSRFIGDYINDSKKLTHLGIIVKEYNQFKVIQSLSSNVADFEGVQKTDLADFVRHSVRKSVVVTRLKNEDTQTPNKIKERAYHYLQRQVPFDLSFDFNDTTELYCSELLWLILERDLQLLQVDTLQYPTDKDKYWALQAFYDTAYFDIILDHTLGN